MLKIEQGQIEKYFNIDIFIVICSLYAEYYHEECFTTIFALVTDESDQNDISDRYIKSFLWRKASAINSTDFITYINEYGAPRNSVLRVLIENSTKENHPQISCLEITIDFEFSATIADTKTRKSSA